MSVMSALEEHRPALLELRDSVTGQGRLARTQNFLAQWCEGPLASSIESAQELMVFFVDGGALPGGPAGAVIPAKSLAILPPGRHEIRAPKGSRTLILATDRQDIDPDSALNTAQFRIDPRIAPTGEPFARRRGEGEIHIYPMDAVKAPPGNERLKIFQSTTLSINFVEYRGPRARDALSPHSHVDIEQGTLILEGQFMHHLREEWGKNADLWREDAHLQADAATLLRIPPKVIHTTEGVGEGTHMLLDIFSPPRRDFIAKGWVLNSGDYSDPETPQ